MEQGAENRCSTTASRKVSLSTQHPSCNTRVPHPPFVSLTGRPRPSLTTRVPHPPPSSLIHGPRPSPTACVPHPPQRPSPSTHIPHLPPASLTLSRIPHPPQGPSPLPSTLIHYLHFSSRSQKACLGHRQNPNYRKVCKLLLAESLLLH